VARRVKSSRSVWRYGLLALIAGLVWTAYAALRVPSVATPYEFRIREGQGLAGVAHALTESGRVGPAWLMTAIGRLNGTAARVVPGIYRVEQPLSLLGLLNNIAAGDRLRVRVTLVEGWNLRQVRAELTNNGYLAQDSAELSDAVLAQSLNLAATSPEGMLFPDTYWVDAGSSDLQLLIAAARLMRERLDAAWKTRAPNLPYRTPYEALVMASIIEKETGQGVERPQIAAVFVNRLKMGMALQTDPTVIYGLGQAFDGNLRRADLQRDTPWNTYTRPGLPPTPIALPGAAAIDAALHPAESKALYFVARGDGYHVFSDNLNAHNRAVRQYQRK